MKKSTPRKRKKWVMPAWMAPFRDAICNTGGNSVEELMNDHESNPFTNHIRAALCVAVKSQVSLLNELHRRGKL